MTLETYLHEHIPLSKAMGVKVVSASPEQVILSAPLANNINHKQTAFGGSLHALATLSCWSLLHLHFPACQIVIAHSEIDYLIPVTTEFTAQCSMPNLQDWDRFQYTLAKKGKARIVLTATVLSEGRTYVTFTGTFVAIN